MPTPVYLSLVRVVGGYLGSPKDAEVVDRQLAAMKMSSDTLTASDLKALETRLGCACCLYIDDPKKRDEFKAKVRTLG